MKFYEHEAKEIFNKFGIQTPKYKLIRLAEDTARIFNEIGGTVVLKPLGIKQRGKQGYVFFVDNADEAKEKTEKLLAVEGVSQVLAEEKVNIKKELYVGITIDHSAGKIVLILSSEGGVDIEDISKKEPGKIKKIYINILDGLRIEEVREAIRSLGLEEIKDLENIVQKIYKIFKKYDAEILEINPLAIAEDGKLVAVDAVLNISDDALFRHPEFEALAKERNYATEIERLAGNMGWSYIELDGNIGILSSGAGLTMSILDLIKLYGGKPSNFLDTAQMGADEIYKAFEILSKNQKIKVIFVNIFAGLNRCDDLAVGIRRYVLDYNPKTPIVVRMIGNMEDEGFKILKEIGIEPIKELEAAVEKAVNITKNM